MVGSGDRTSPPTTSGSRQREPLATQEGPSGSKAGRLKERELLQRASKPGGNHTPELHPTAPLHAATLKHP